MDRAFLEGLDLGDGTRLPEAAIEAILARQDKQSDRSDRARFTARMARDGDGTMTREQIMAIPDRSLRRAAIAENLDLFEKEK